MACLRLVTFLPLRPDFSLPCFISRISRSTFLPAEGEYLRLDDDFFAPVLLRTLVFFALMLLRDELLLLRAPDFFEEVFRENDFFVPLDLFLAALVAMTILPMKLRWLTRSSCCLLGAALQATALHEI
jgi:hypothetical protein